MTSVYPTALDSLTNPTASQPTTAPSHAGQHTDANDAIEAIEAELGLSPSGSYATVKARLDTGPWIDAQEAGGLQAAHDLLPASGGGIFLPTDYVDTRTSTATISKNDVTVMGAGWTSGVKANTSWTTTNTSLVSVTGARVRITGLTLDGNKTGRGALTSVHTIRWTGDDGMIDHCRITDDVWEAIRCNTGSTILRLHVLDNLFDTGYGGYIVLASPTRCTISRNRMLANTSDAPINLKPTGATGNLISDNLIIDSPDSGINLSAATSAVRNVITGNVIVNPTGPGITLAAATDSLIANNLITDAGGTGILAGARTVIVGNRIIAAGDVGGSSNPDGIFAANDCTITGNIVQNSGRSGVRVDGVSRVTITGNVISGSGAVTTGREVNVRGASTYVTVAGNAFGGGGANLDIGILVEGAGTDNVSITGNAISGYSTPISKAGTAGHNVRIAGNLGFNPQGTASITVTASPFTYTNTDGVPEAIYIRSGTVSDVSKNGRTVFAATNCTVWLEPNEAVVVTYSVAPTMEKDRK